MLDDTYRHTPYHKAFAQGGVYGIALDEARAARPLVRLGICGAGGADWVQADSSPAVQTSAIHQERGCGPGALARILVDTRVSVR